MEKRVGRSLIIAALALTAALCSTAVSWSQADGARSELRAFYTAPPVIPHENDDQTGETCLMCHAALVELGDRTTVPTPHPQFTNCLQCHVTVGSADGQSSPPVANDWVGLEEPTAGERLSEVAPPTIPHRIFLREDCLSCHHPEHPNEAQRCAHPERTNCLQCHVADPAKEFYWEPVR